MVGVFCGTLGVTEKTSHTGPDIPCIHCKGGGGEPNMNHNTKEAMPFIGRRLVFIYSESPGGVLYTLLKVVSLSSICKVGSQHDASGGVPMPDL